MGFVPGTARDSSRHHLGWTGQTLEQGEAALINDAWREYATTAPHEAKVTVEAFDLAGNVTRHEA